MTRSKQAGFTAREFLLSLLTLVISIGISILMLELAVSYLYRDSGDSTDKSFDEWRGWSYVPGNFSEKPEGSFVPHAIRINRLGLRGDLPAELEKDPAGRVIVLGDSFTFGRAVSEEAVYTRVLADMLNEQNGGKHLVINAGVEGYGTAQQLLLLRELTAKGIVGDTYVLQMFTNDILDNLRLQYSSMELERLQPKFIVGADGRAELVEKPDASLWVPKPKGHRRFGFRSLKVLKSLLESYAQSNPGFVRFARSIGIPMQLPRLPGVINAWYTDSSLKEGLPLMAALMNEIKVEVNRLNARLVVVVIPSPFNVYPETYNPILKESFPDDPRIDAFIADLDRPQREVMNICTRIQVDCVDMLPVFKKDPNTSYFIPREGHLNDAGHAELARTLAAKLGADPVH